MPRKTNQPKWLPKVEEHDFAAAASYLALIHPRAQCKTLVAALRAAELVQFRAKDIFRASGLSPLLLVRDEKNGKVIVADGYHRLCAVYQIDEDAWIPCKIV